MNERDIVYESGKFWVRRAGPGHFEVYQRGPTASTRVATVHYSGDEVRALKKATNEADRRALAALTHH